MRQFSLPVKSQKFLKDDKGAVAIVMGLSIIPLILASGLAADYAIALTSKARLDSSADAAALAAIKTAQMTVAELSRSSPSPNADAITAATAQAEKSFYAQAGKQAAALTGKPKINVAINGQEVTADVSYAAAVPANFGKLAGVKTMKLDGSAGAQLTMAKFLDFYLLLDVSGSMGLPSTIAGQAALAAKNPDDGGGCQFACHFPGKQGYSVARANKIELRIDSVGSAVAELMKTAKSSQTLDKQYRVGVYPFVSHANAFVDLTDNLTGDASSVAQAINYNEKTKSSDFGKLLDMGADSVFARSLNPNYKANPNIPQDTKPLGAGGTHIENVFDDINGKIKSVGDGSGAMKTQPFVFFVSDGMQNSQSFVTSTGRWPGVTTYPTSAGATVSIRAMDPAACAALKKRGVTVSVLEIPYPAFPHPTTFANSQEFKANDAIPNLPSAMKACASDGFYFTANTPQEITAAMQKMFAQAVQSARLTR